MLSQIPPRKTAKSTNNASIWSNGQCNFKKCSFLYSLDDQGFFSATSIGFADSKRKYQWTSWHFQSGSLLLLFNLFCVEDNLPAPPMWSTLNAAMQSVLHVLTLVKTCTLYNLQTWYFHISQATDPCGVLEKHHTNHTHSVKWLTWQVQHSGRNRFPQWHLSVSVSLWVGWCLWAWCSSNAG